MFKVLLYRFSVCRHKHYQILSISKNVPCFVFLMTGYCKVYTIQDKTAQVLKFSNSKTYHFRGQYAKLMLAIIPGALLSHKFYFFFFLFCIFQLYIIKFLVCSVFKTVELVKERSCAMPSLNK